MTITDSTSADTLVRVEGRPSSSRLHLFRAGESTSVCGRLSGGPLQRSVEVSTCQACVNGLTADELAYVTDVEDQRRRRRNEIARRREAEARVVEAPVPAPRLDQPRERLAHAAQGMVDVIDRLRDCTSSERAQVAATVVDQALDVVLSGLAPDGADELLGRWVELVRGSLRADPGLHVLAHVAVGERGLQAERDAAQAARQLDEAPCVERGLHLTEARHIVTDCPTYSGWRGRLAAAADEAVRLVDDGGPYRRGAHWSCVHCERTGVVLYADQAGDRTVQRAESIACTHARAHYGTHRSAYIFAPPTTD